jgi:hypothetical protein
MYSVCLIGLVGFTLISLSLSFFLCFLFWDVVSMNVRFLLGCEGRERIVWDWVLWCVYEIKYMHVLALLIVLGIG